MEGKYRGWGEGVKRNKVGRGKCRGRETRKQNPGVPSPDLGVMRSFLPLLSSLGGGGQGRRGAGEGYGDLGVEK